MSRLYQNLTNIPNRNALLDDIEKCAKRYSSLSLMLVDVVRFSDVTTSMGMRIADQVLLEIANRMLLLFDDNARIGRVSGDVFGLVFPEKMQEQELQAKFERLAEHFKVPMHFDSHSYIADFNVGAVRSKQSRFELSAFVSRAETALKQAKNNKYENFCIMTMHEKANTGRSLALKADLCRALQENELELYFQPQIDLDTLTIVSAECLLRWNHPQDGVLFPGALIEAAESYNMMNELAYWTLEQAFRNMAKLNVAGVDIMLTINISPTQLYDSQLIDTLKRLRDSYQLSLSRFELELTEDVALSNSLKVKKQLYQLKALGIDIAVDDFGKGYSNLAYIRELSINSLKIDKMFVMELNGNKVNQAIIRAAKLIADAKGCDVIAEGIENIEQLHALREIGIKTGQGFLFSPAVPFDAFVKLTDEDIMVGDSPLRRILR